MAAMRACSLPASCRGASRGVRAAPRCRAGPKGGVRAATVEAPPAGQTEGMSVIGSGLKFDLGDTSTLTMRLDGQWYDVSGWAKVCRARFGAMRRAAPSKA